MAISRAQLLKELLPGLNKVFEDAYVRKLSTCFKEDHMEGNEHYEDLSNVPLPTLRDIWLVRFGEVLTDEALRDDPIISSDYMYAVGTMLKKWGYLTYDVNTNTLKLNDKPTYADYRQQGSPVQNKTTN